MLPLVLRIRENIDEVFARYVGPISAELCREEFDRWAKEGDVGPSSLHRYVSYLAAHIRDDASRRTFIGDASKKIVPDSRKS